MRSFAQTSIFYEIIWDFALLKFSYPIKTRTRLVVYHCTAQNVKHKHKSGSVMYIISWPIFMIMKCCTASGQIPATIISAANEWWRCFRRARPGCGYASCRCLAVLCSFIQARPQRTGYMISVQNNIFYILENSATVDLKQIKYRPVLESSLSNSLNILIVQTWNSQIKQVRKLTQAVWLWSWKNSIFLIKNKEVLVYIRLNL